MAVIRYSPNWLGSAAMNQFAPRRIEQISLGTLERSLKMYEEMLDVLEDGAGERSQSLREDILEARELVQMEIARRRLKQATDGSEAA